VTRHPGLDGWVAVAVVVLAAEMLDTRTLSDAWRSAPLRYTVPIAILTNAHLFGLLPPAVDPFSWASKLPIYRRPRQ
jgi:hypothetical protein